MYHDVAEKATIVVHLDTSAPQLRWGNAAIAERPLQLFHLLAADDCVEVQPVGDESAWMLTGGKGLGNTSMD